MTPQELKMVCGESNEINGEKLFCVGPLRKNCLLLIRTENKAYRPNAHLLYFVMHYNGSII